MIFYKEKFRFLRESRGLTLKDVADALGVSEATVQKWEKRANFQPRPKKIEGIAKILNCKMSDICNLFDPISEEKPFDLDEKLDYIVSNWDKLTKIQKAELVDFFSGMVNG